MEPPHVKKHEYEMSEVNGALSYSIDHGPLVTVHFTQHVQLTVFLDPNRKTTKVEDNKVVNSKNGIGYEQSRCNQPFTKIQTGAKTLGGRNKNKSVKEAERKVSTVFEQRQSGEEASRIIPESSITVGVNGVEEYLEENTETLEDWVEGEGSDKGNSTKARCQYCGKEFPNLQQYYNHRRTDESVHTCGICGKVEPFEAHLIVHMQKHQRIQLEDGEAKVETGKGKKKKKEQMKCNVCGLVVSSADSLKIHTMLHTGESPYKCCLCLEKFPSLSSRQHHMETHITVERFRCVTCDVRFSSRADLAKHQLSHQFKCTLCGELFPNKTSRTAHFRVAHPDDILRCKQCPALFSCPQALARHNQYHAKDRRQQCPTCGLVVTKLKEHMLLHTTEPQARMYVCDQCPASYLRKSNLERHMRTHSGEKPYSCNQCPKKFRSNGMLRKHLLTHTQERPFQCEVCGKRCALRSNLAVHMRVHSSHRQFSCPHCPQAFNHKNSLQGHIKNKHSKSPAATIPALSLPVTCVASMVEVPNSPHVSQVPQMQPVSFTYGMTGNEDRQTLSQFDMQLAYSINSERDKPTDLPFSYTAT